MIKFISDMKNFTPLKREQAEYLVRVSSRFEARILLRYQNRTVNGRSLLGLLSLGYAWEEPVCVELSGPDEEKAAATLKQILQEGIILPRTEVDAERLLIDIKSRFSGILCDNLAGLYVHGSLAWGCFNWETSDIDLLLVLKREPETEIKVRLLRALAECEEKAPPHGFEMCVITEAECREIHYPTPFVLHYSAMHRDNYRKDPQGYCEKMHGTDPDIVCHIAEVRTACIVLLGPPAGRMFGSVKQNDLKSSIFADLDESVQYLHTNPVYTILNICRTVAMLREGRMMSKKDGGEWALQNLRQKYQRLIQSALNAYRGGNEMSYSNDEAKAFCMEYIDEIHHSGTTSL